MLFFVKKEILLQAVAQLKEEFVGIDGIIDELSDIILPWWLFPENQFKTGYANKKYGLSEAIFL
jgi:hypothetical protein